MREDFYNEICGVSSIEKVFDNVGSLPHVNTIPLDLYFYCVFSCVSVLFLFTHVNIYRTCSFTLLMEERFKSKVFIHVRNK